VPITISGVAIEPGDIIFCDPAEGVVRIPADLLERVIHWLQARHGAEERVKRFVAGGGSVQEAFERFR
jgi:regulator of RNase E activity RraA